MKLAFILALRDLRGGTGVLRGMRIVLACLALGVAAIAAVGSLNASVDRGLRVQGRVLLGGDLAIDGGGQPLPASLGGWLEARHARRSEIVTMRSLLVAPSGERALIDLKVVDAAYPLVGAVTLAPAQGLAEALRGQEGGQGGVVADPLVIARLDLKPGDPVRLGQAHLTLRAALAGEPDHAGSAILGPRVILGAANLAATGLVQPGSLLTYEWRVLLPPGADPDRMIADLRHDFPGSGWRIRSAAEPPQGLERAIAQTSLFLTLVGLSSLLVGGIGVATGVRAWLDGRARTIAILRCLGAQERTLFAMILMQVLGLCVLGVAIGVALGAALPALAIARFGDSLPVPAEIGLYPAPLAQAALYGLLTAAVFSLWPLGRAARIPGGALFRDAILPDGTRPRAPVIAACVALAVALAALVVLGAADRGFAASFCGCALGTLAIFRAGAWALMAAARRLRPARPSWLRLGIANLHRPGSATPLLMVGLGLGFATLTTVALIQGNIRASLLTELPRDAPRFFFIDIQNAQLEPFLRLVGSEPGVTDIHEVPSLRARIVALNGVPVDRVHVAPDSQWALRGDRGLTYAADMPRGSTLAAGAWWPHDYAGPPLLSLDADLARGWGLGIGGTLRANVLGRDIDFRVASTRRVNWRGMALNFTMVASPGLLEHAPHMHIATLRNPPRVDAALLRVVTDAMPNVTGISVADILAQISAIIGKLAAALAAAGSVTLGAGALVLAGAVAAGQRRRLEDAVVLKTLGATRGQIQAAWLVEFGCIGAAAGAMAAILGAAASFAMMRLALHAPWRFLPGTVAMSMGGCVALMVVFGWVGTAGVARRRAAGYLRER
jgi:putative ABC transport system permease protein